MMIITILAIALLMIVAFYFTSSKSPSPKKANLDFLPKNEKVYFNEKYMETKLPRTSDEEVKLVGQADLVSIDDNDVLHIYDFKNRKPGPIYFKEKVQLATYHFLLQSTQTKKVSHIAHIVFLGRGSPIVENVDISKINIIQQVQNYIKDSTIKPTATKGNKCTWCQYNSICS